MRGGWSMTAFAASGAIAALEAPAQHSEAANWSPPSWKSWAPWKVSSWTPPTHTALAFSVPVMPIPHNQTSSVSSIAVSSTSLQAPYPSISTPSIAVPSASHSTTSSSVPVSVYSYIPHSSHSKASSSSSSTYLHTLSVSTSSTPQLPSTHSASSKSSSISIWSATPLSSSTYAVSSSHSWEASSSISQVPTYSKASQVSKAPSTVVVYAAKTEVVYETVGHTVTACPDTATACPAASTYVTMSSVSVGSKAWSSYASSSTAAAACSLPSSPLTNEEQVGDTKTGTLCEKTFPKWLDGKHGQKYSTAPWGDKTTTNSDATIKGDIPTTNVTRYYDFTISRGQISADGVLRDVILVNDQFPGPVIEANWGDYIQVKVTNKIENPMEGTSLHWHGMLQKNSPWYDGVPAVGQCPIAPGHSFTYIFQAELYGTSWYHGHYSAQYSGGVVGAMQIYGPSQLDYDIDVGPVMLSDWYHVPYFSIVADAVGTDLAVIPPTSDNLLINGRASFDCSKPSYSNSTEWLGSNLQSNISWTCVENATLSKFRFHSGKTHRMRLINHGADGVHKVSIDGHKMTVIAIDYVPVVPFEADVVTLGVGQRTDVLVKATSDKQSAYWMRTRAPGGAACGGSDSPETLAAIYYEDADTTTMPTTSSAVNSTTCANDALASSVPEFKITPSANPYQQDLELSLVMNATGNYEWQINNQTFRANFNEPLLFKAAAGNVSYPYSPQWNVYNFDKNNSVVLNVTNGTPFAHPFHLHGHNFYVLNEGTGVWDGSVINAGNPMRRDIQIIQASGYSVFQFEADNPGVWPFHCHVAWHLSGGLAMNVISRPDEIPAIPDIFPQTCTDWDWYSNHNVVDQIDAGS